MSHDYRMGIAAPFLAAALLLGASVAVLAGKPQPPPPAVYTYTSLGQVACYNSKSKSYGITEPDADGVVLMVAGGHYSAPSPDYATEWDATAAGVLSTSILPNSRRGTAAVNNEGMIAYWGYSETQTTYLGMVEVPGVGPVELPSYFQPTAVNNQGQVVGSMNGGDGMLITVNSDGTYSIELSPALWGFVPYAINDSSEMAGQHGNAAAIAWFEDGELQVQDLPLTALPAGSQSLGAGINNVGEVVGSWSGNPFLWRPTEGIVWLTPNATNPGAALDINDHGQVVGWSYDSYGRKNAFLWENGQLSDLNVLSGVGTKSFRLASADAINEAGQIIGHSETWKGQYVASYGTYLLTPK